MKTFIPANLIERSLRHRNQAFTLVEVLVVIGLLVLFSAMVFRFFIGASSSQQRVAGDLQMQARVLNSQNRIIRMVREGTDFIIPALGEESQALFFIDGESNIQVLYQLKDPELSKSTGKKLFKLMHYRVDVKKFNIGSPGYDPKSSSVVAENVKDMAFRISSANTVNVTACFATEKAEFQTMFEVGLQNSGEIE